LTIERNPYPDLWGSRSAMKIGKIEH
jgi:hypothetical protein